MALTADEAREHIAKRRQALEGAAYPHRVRWPARLFHHSPIENAVAILGGRELKARNDATLQIRRDVAGDGVIQARQDAHDFVRLYFRPRTPTQFHIEGIRKPEDCQFGHQAPVLIMFIFRAAPILTTAGVLFSDRNMQRNGNYILE